MLPPILILTIMLHFNELYITEDNKCLVIDVEVDDYSVYDSCYIDTIDFSLGAGCDDGTLGDFVSVYSDDGEHEKHKRFVLETTDESVVQMFGDTPKSFDGLVFVKVTAMCDTETLVKTECGCESNEICGIAYNGKPIYDNAVKYADSYGASCSNNDMTAFLDWLLRYYGFLFALKNGDLCQAKYYWNNYLKGSASVARSSNPCGCHGTR